MAERNELIAKLQGQIDDWKSEMKALEDRADDAGDEVKAKCCEAMDELRFKCAEGEAKLEEWKNKAEDAWENVQQEVEESLASFKYSIATSIDRIKSYFA